MKNKLLNKKRVIEVAATLFLEKGYAYTSMDELVRASKVSKSNVYYHFDNKEELLLGVIDYWVDTYTRAIDESLTKSELTVEERVMHFLETLSKGVQNREYNGSCPFITIYIQSPLNATEVKEKISSFFGTLQNKMIHLFRQGMETGELKDNLNIKEVSALFITNLEGALFLSETLKDEFIILKTAKQFFNLLRK